MELPAPRIELFAPADDAPAMAMESDGRHVNRLQKPPLSPIRVHQELHVAGPEDDDDFITDRDLQEPVGMKGDINNSSVQHTEDHMTALPPPIPVVSVTQHPAPLPTLNPPRTRLYPWLDEQHTTITRVDQHSALLPAHASRSEPTRHGYNTIAAHHSGTDQSHSNSGHQSVHTRLLSSSPAAAAAQAHHPTRPSTGHDFWHTVTAPGTTTAAYGSSNNSSRRHSILRLGSSRRPHSGHGMKKSASVEFKLHNEAHLKHAASETKHYSGHALGRDMPR